jgi:hypothetical protein
MLESQVPFFYLLCLFVPEKLGPLGPARDNRPAGHFSFLFTWGDGVLDYWSVGKHLTRGSPSKILVESFYVSFQFVKAF